ncbi:MAG: FUN14 domain-containing protein [Candidatus Rifleibacteriota bacterium]
MAQELASGSVVPMLAASGSQLLESMPPELKFTIVTLGSGGIAGWAVGFTLKKFAKLAALIVGVAFITIQYLAFNRYITIDWERIRQSVPDETIEQSWTSLMSMLTYNLPFAGAFLVGFWMGFRKG